MVKRERVEEMIQEDADWARKNGYESTAQVHEQRLADYHARRGQEEGQHQPGK